MIRKKSEDIEIIFKETHEDGLCLYEITAARVPENPDEAVPDETIILREKDVVGTERTVKKFIEHYASEDFPELKFEWNNPSSYISKPFGKKGSTIVIGFERIHKLKGSIYAVILPSDLKEYSTL